MSSQLQVVSARDRRLYGDPTIAPVALDAVTPFADDLKGVLDTLRRRAGVFLAAFACVVVAAVAWLYYTIPIYSATTTIVLESPKQVMPSAATVLADMEPDSSMVDTQVQVIQSRAVLGRAVDGLGLLDEAEEYGLTRDNLIDAIRDNLAVSRVGLSYALSITYQDADAEQSARGANAVATAYLEHQLGVKQQATKDAYQWLSQNVGELRQQVATADAAVESYRARSGLLVARGTTSTENEVTDLDVGLSAARKDLSDAEARLAGFQGALETLGAASAAEVVSTPLIQQLRSQYAALANQKAQLSPTLGALHPQMMELNKQMMDVQRQMNAEAQRTVDELRSDVTIAANRVNGLLTIRDRSRRQLVTDNSANVELVELQSSAASLRGLYEAMLTRLQQTVSQESLGQVNATIVSEAVIPLDPSSPRKNVILAGAVVAGLALGALAVLLAQLFDQTIVRSDEFERRTRLPLLALVPKLTPRDLKVGKNTVPIADFVLGNPMSLFTESFRNLRVAVCGTVERGQSVVVQFTSGTFGEGKTLCAIAFARTAALDGKRVLLIDADTRRRSLTQCLGIDAKNGLGELLRGKAELNEVIVPGGTRRRPHVLPLVPNEDHPYDIFSTKAFEQLLVKLKEGFDVIVIDSAPVLAVAEPISIASRVDTVVMVARWAHTPVDVVLKAVEEIRRAGGHLVGTVLTQVDVKKVAAREYGRKYYPALMKYYR